MKKCIIDIDGVLNYYPDTFIQFVNDNLGSDYINLNEIKVSLNYAKYHQLKHKYRESGIKQDLEVRAGAKEFLSYLTNVGYYVIILSSRPVEVVNGLIIQTTKWLKKNGLEYDFLDFGYRKHINVIERFGEVEFVVDDNFEIAQSLTGCVNKVFLINNIYNNSYNNSKIIRINSFNEIIEKMEEM